MVSPSPHFPSELRFGSYLIYPSPAISPDQKQAKDLILALKANKYTSKGSVIEAVIARLKADAPSVLAELLDGKSVLVPMPGSSPLLKNAVWSSRTICEAMIHAGLGKEMREYVERTTAIRKSAYCAARVEPRPTPREHYDTMAAKTMLGAAERVVLVDDVITQGATISAAATRLLEAFPSMSIRAFAVATLKPRCRTSSHRAWARSIHTWLANGPAEQTTDLSWA